MVISNFVDLLMQCLVTQELAENGELEQMLPKSEDLNTRYEK